MGSHGEIAKRPICPQCTKPLKLCLCSRFKSPPLDNAIRVTVLQHEYEVKHPLNSTRVAKLGLRNLAVVCVADVNLHCQIEIRPLNDGILGFNGEFGGSCVNFDGGVYKFGVSDFDGGVCDGKMEVCSLEGKRMDLSQTHLKDCCVKKEREEFCDNDEGNSNSDNCIIKMEMDKYKVICSNSEINIYLERTAKPDLDWVLNAPIGRKLISNGFQVRKVQTKKKPNSTEIYEIEEYFITIPPNSALLFPNEKSINLNSIDFEVKNLIVLDGTWAKAQRMYHENPWLKLLPHLKLDLKRESLYSEVRHEPKAGCLSTIESIIFAMKELGNDLDGLDSILGVFESMILDQRRCKDERLCVSSQN